MPFSVFHFNIFLQFADLRSVLIQAKIRYFIEKIFPVRNFQKFCVTGIKVRFLWIIIFTNNGSWIFGSSQFLSWVLIFKFILVWKLQWMYRTWYCPEAVAIGILWKKVSCNFIKIETLLHRWFRANFAKFLRMPFLQNTSGQLLLTVSNLSYQLIVIKKLKKNNDLVFDN